MFNISDVFDKIKKEFSEEEKPVITKGGKTLTGKKPAEIDVKPKINKEA